MKFLFMSNICTAIISKNKTLLFFFFKLSTILLKNSGHTKWVINIRHNGENKKSKTQKFYKVNQNNYLSKKKFTKTIILRDIVQ